MTRCVVKLAYLWPKHTTKVSYNMGTTVKLPNNGPFVLYNIIEVVLTEAVRDTVCIQNLWN